MEHIKFFIGPMSKNIVDAILEYVEETGNKIGLIPSRRQVEYNGGYVNNWTTEQFSKYVNKRTIIKRDHSGPGQGYEEDDGFNSLKEDCKWLDIIHIDPWKKYTSYEEGLKWTIDMINFCYKENPNVKFEVGTEQAIREFESEELNKLLEDLKKSLLPEVFNNIEYLVIQSGTSLKGTYNTGEYSKGRLEDMVNIANKWNLISKEHNGDYIPAALIKEKMKLGLNSINIAPEFGLLETNTYLNKILDESLLDKLWKICYDSKRWVKWVDESFDPLVNKRELIKICGHYILSTPEFIELKKVFGNIDTEIKSNVKSKLRELYG